MGKRDNLNASAINRYFYKCASSDYFWTDRNNTGKHGLLVASEVEQCENFTRNYNKQMTTWKLGRLDHLFYTKLHEKPNFERRTTRDAAFLEEEGLLFKVKYAKYSKELVLRKRILETEKKVKTTKENERSEIRSKWESCVNSSWIGFVIIAILSIMIGMILIPLSMDEIIPNEIGTYYWLISWLSLGIVSIPYFLLLVFVQVNIYEFYPMWTRRQLTTFKMQDMGEITTLFSSTFMWVPYFYLVGGLKYAVFPDNPILSYIAIPGYVLAMVSICCGAPALKSS